MIVGIDEVGRGPWAGPLVVGAVVLGDSVIEGLTDSKQLTKRRREELAPRIIKEAASFGLGWVMSDELDRIGLSAALTEATKRALEQITVPYHEIILDGTVNFLKDTKKGRYVTTMKKADLLIAAVSAASIIAKVARDDYMADLEDSFPGYDFATNAGYGTAHHRNAIAERGVTPQHRRSFAPIAAVLGDTGAASRTIAAKMPATTPIGTVAESAAADWLTVRGYDVIERNWKTRYCEIDIIAVKDGTLFFIEVKHRRQKGQGGGIAAITPRKLRQMIFAARVYSAHVKHDGDAALAVVTTIGDDPVQIEQFLRIEES